MFALTYFIDKTSKEDVKPDDLNLKFLFVYGYEYSYNDRNGNSRKGYPWFLLPVKLSEIQKMVSDSKHTVDGKQNSPPGFWAVDHSDFIFQAFPGVPMDSF